MIPRDLVSSFGPYGGSKIINTGTGEVIITRDGRQILHHCDLPRDVLSRLLINSCERFGNRYGDGTSTLLLLIDAIVRRLATEHPDLMGRNYRARVQLLQALEVVISCFHRNHSQIRQHFLESHIYTSVSSYRVVATALWSNLLGSALTEEMSATLVSLLLQWFDADATLPQFRRTCLQISDNIDILLLESHLGFLRESRVLAKDELLVEGRIREFSLFRLRREAFTFVCIKVWNDGTPSMPLEVKVDNDAKLSAVFGIGKMHLHQTLLELRSCGVDCVITSDHIEDEVLYLFSSVGVLLIDRLSSKQLEWLVSLTCGGIYDSCMDFLARVKLNQPPFIGAFKSANPVIYSAHDRYIHLKGISLKSGHACPAQLVVCSGSHAISRLYTSLMKRCLALVISTCSDASEWVVALGAGRIEMFISATLLDVSTALAEPPQEMLPLEGITLSLSHQLAQQIRSCCKQRQFETNGCNRAMLLCLYLSDAYSSIPRLILTNYIYTIHDGCYRTRSIEEMMAYWRKNMDDLQKTDGVRGLLQIFGFLEPSESLHLLMIPEKIVWSGLIELLEMLRMYLRVGGSKMVC